MPGIAGPLLDSMRNIDLNNYALGVGISFTENPYTGAGDSRFAFPYLTSLQDTTLTKDTFLISGSEVGARLFSTNTNWEFGVIGRLQTLGFGADTGPELGGLEPVGWTVEAGGMIGWRGGPVQIQLKHYWELLGRHSGTTQELRFSYPRALPNGFLVPYASLIHQSSEYTDYYFGVEPADSSPDRAAYEPGSATNIAAGVRWGYRLSPDWLLSVSASVQAYDDAISASDLVDRDYVSSMSLGIAYNRDVFRRHQAAEASAAQRRWELSVSYIDAAISSVQRTDADTRSVGSTLDLEDSLGLSESDEVLVGKIAWRFAYYHRLEAEYLRISRHGSVTLQAPIDIGDVTLPEGDTIRTNMVFDLPQISYGYSILRDAQKEFGVFLGLHVPGMETQIADTGGRQVSRARTTAPLPVLGAFGSLALPAHMSLRARLQLFGLEVDTYEGSMAKLELGLEYAPAESLSLLLGWSAYRLNLTAADSSFHGKLKIDYHGLLLAAAVRF